MDSELSGGPAAASPRHPSNDARPRAGWLGAVAGLSLAAATPGEVDASQAIGSGSIEHACVIEPIQVVKVASPVVGVIARLAVDRGDLVKAGQIVAELEHGVETAALELARARATNESNVKAAEARLKFLTLKHNRVDVLSRKSLNSLNALQEAEAEVDVAEQQLKEAQLAREVAKLEVNHAEEVVKLRTVRSPIDGVVVERLLSPGEYRNEQTPILTLAEIARLRVEVFLPTSRYHEVRVGSRAEVRPEAPIGGVYTATVDVVDHVFDAASGTFGVRLSLANPDLALPAGIRCNITFNGDEAGGPALAVDTSLPK